MSEFDDWYSPGRWEPQESWLEGHVGAVDESQASTPADPIPSNVETPRASPAPISRRLRCRQRRRSPGDRLLLLQLEDWQSDRVYDEDPPTCVHYSLEWRVASNGKPISKDTEPNLVLSPSAFWQRTLRSRLDRLVGRKMGDADIAKAEETSITVSVTDRSERDLTKQFDELDIDWTAIEGQLVEWSDLFRHGKKLRVDITFHYVMADETAGCKATTKSGARGRTSTTQRMLATRNAQVQAEESSQGGPSVWADTYQKVRCLESCPLGPHCWCDPRDKKHYKLSTHHLRRLVKFVQDGGTFHSHADLPEPIQADLYAEAEATQSRKRKARAMSPPAMTPITINNHFPEQPSLAQPANEAGRSSTKHVVGGVTSPLVVSGYLDTAVRGYTKWQQSRFEDAELKDEMSKACDIVLGHGLTLAHIYDDQDFQFLIDGGIKQGIARHFVGDIKVWTKHSQDD